MSDNTTADLLTQAWKLLEELTEVSDLMRVLDVQRRAALFVKAAPRCDFVCKCGQPRGDGRVCFDRCTLVMGHTGTHNSYGHDLRERPTP